MEHKDEIVVAVFHNVVISRIGVGGVNEVYEPSKLTVYTVKSRGCKGWFVARNPAGNSLNFNAYIPGGCPVLMNEQKREIYFGKVPSLSFVDKRGKGIPTMWTFKLRNNAALESLYGLLVLFSKLAAAVNKLPLPTTLFASNPIESPSTTGLSNDSVNLLEESVEEDDADADGDADADDDADDDVETVSTNVDKKGDGLDHLFSPMSASSNEFAESQDILGKRMDDGLKNNDLVDKENFRYEKNKKAMMENNKKLKALLLSPLSASSAEPGSPVFAESQDILAGLGGSKKGHNKYFDCFSPLSDDEAY